MYKHTIAFLLLFSLVGCATESSRSVQTKQVRAASIGYSGPKVAVSIGKFRNQSKYMRGIFSDGVDRLGGQAKTILTTHLQQTGRFSLLDRSNLEEIKSESELLNHDQKLKGANFVISGDVTEFGRKEIGDHQLFGVLGSGKQQIAYSVVSLYVINVKSGEVIDSVQGAGEYSLSNREVLGFGGSASYDSTLNGKVLDLAIREAVDQLVLNLESKSWE
ncbi:MAG: CsgG/HfaB family protein [Opitutales bacterium]|nr:CsgG/HfaB family protein [Opitutales bacterium]